MSDPHALSGAYALDAVDDVERAQFERHLAECPDCQVEVAELRETAALLALAVPYVPSEAMRERVLAEATTVRPLPPVVTPIHERSGSHRRRWTALAAAAAAVVALGAGAAIVQPWSDEPATQTISAADQVFAAPDAESFDTVNEDGVRVSVARSDSLRQSAVRTSGLPKLSDNRVYQMWLVHDARMVPAGLMLHGNGEYLISGDAATASAAAISVEPAGGSDEPTGSVVARVDFEQST